MEPSSIHGSADLEPRPARSVAGLMIAVALATLGIVFVIALFDMRASGPAPAPRGGEGRAAAATQDAHEGAKVAPEP